MKKYACFFFGGSSYAVPCCETDEPEFRCNSLKAAREWLARVPDDSYFPCCYDDQPDEGGPELWAFCTESRDYPDYRVFFGPRGGVRSERF